MTVSHLSQATSGDFRAVTPSDSVDLPEGVRALWVGGQGTVMAVNRVTGATVPFVGAVGELNIRPSRILATGTTATSIVALF